jgi:hypothetical protein
MLEQAIVTSVTRSVTPTARCIFLLLFARRREQEEEAKPPWSAAQTVDGITFLAFSGRSHIGREKSGRAFSNIADNTPAKIVRYFLWPHRSPLEGLQTLPGILSRSKPVHRTQRRSGGLGGGLEGR